jgi:phosphate transport system permease protein
MRSRSSVPKKSAFHADAVLKSVFMLSAVFAIFAVLAIFVFLFWKGIPAIAKIGLKNFLFGRVWRPFGYDTYDSGITGSYGIFNMIAGSFAATAGALLIGGTTGFFTAVYIAEFCRGWFKKALFRMVSLLAGIPSVVYGFFGLKVLLPILGYFSDNGSGSGIMAVSVVLGVMILPTIVALSVNGLDSVPKSYTEGALALGAKYDRVVFTVNVPAAKSGIYASLILGTGRAIGETMAVIMVAGNSPVIPKDLFSSFRTLTGNVVLEMGYAGELQLGALIGTGCVLFIVVLIINIIFNIVRGTEERKIKRAAKVCKVGKKKKEGPIHIDRPADTQKPVPLWMKKVVSALPSIGKAASAAASFFAFGALLSILLFVFINGLPHIRWAFLTEDFRYGGPQTIFPSIIATLLLVAVSVAVAMPLGVFAAIYMNEYAGKKKGAAYVRLAVETLGGIPSIVYGLFGLIFFSGLLGLGTSILAGALTVAIMIIPVTVRATEESLKSVPDALREGSFALGAGKVRTIFRVVVPSAMPGMVSAVILGISRIVSESAPLLFTMGASLKPTPDSLMSGGTSLAVALYKFAGEGLHVNEAYATAAILVLLVLILNTLSNRIGERLQKKLKGG